MITLRGGPCYTPTEPQPANMPTYTLQKIADHIDGRIKGDPDTLIIGISPVEGAQSGFLTFAENERYLDKALESEATAVITPMVNISSNKCLIQVNNVRAGLAKALTLLHPEEASLPGIHATSVVDPTATVATSACIGPHCIVEKGARIGEHVTLMGHVTMGAFGVIEEDSKVFPNVTIYPKTKIGKRVRIHAGAVIGSDGYGYVLDHGFHRKIPQVGDVIIGDDVEIGANTTLDCGALGSTRIGKGTKIDNLVQIGHNVEIGEHAIIIAQTGVAGSSKIGNYTILAGQSGIAGHLSIGEKAVVAAQSGVMHSIPPGEQWMGSPASPSKQAKRQLIAIQQLPDLLRKIKRFFKAN
jgi:UDP-3-O-[3-hydroxymyristoyl] glucosamine N-acyltransferase